MATKSLSKLKVEMLFNSDLTRLVDVMKGVATSQFFVMEKKKTVLDLYDDALTEFFNLYDFRTFEHPFIRPLVKRKLIVVVTTDSGFLGGLNLKVMQAAFKYEDNETHYAVMGERGTVFLRESGREFTSLPGINIDNTRFELVEQVIKFIFQKTLKREYGQVIFVYPHSVSFTVQRVESLNLIPCPLFYKNKPPEAPDPAVQKKKVILESSEQKIVEYLTWLWLRKRLIECFEDSKSAEFGARTMHLESSFQTLKKIDGQLKLQFFKARREKIDQSLRESFTAKLNIKT